MKQYTLVNNYIKATNSHNFDTLVGIIDPQATYQFTDAVCHGIEEIKEYFEKAWAYVKDEVYSAHDITLVFQNEVIQIYTYEYRYEGYVESKFVSGKGRATNIFQKKEDSWVLILEHLNTI